MTERPWLRWLILIGILLLLGGRAVYVGAIHTRTDRGVKLMVKPRPHEVTATVTNDSPEPIHLTRCTFVVSLSGRIRLPDYKPCKPEPVTLAAGESLTERFEIVKWPIFEEARVNVGYRWPNGQTGHLDIYLSRPWW